MEIQAGRVIAAFFASLAIIFIFGLLVGGERKAKWFKKRTQSMFFNRRGAWGEVCHFGYPCTWQGVAVALVMYGIVAVMAYIIVFKF